MYHQHSLDFFLLYFLQWFSVSTFQWISIRHLLYAGEYINVTLSYESCIIEIVTEFQMRREWTLSTPCGAFDLILKHRDDICIFINASAADCGRAYSIYSECSYHHWQRKSTHEASSILQFTIDITQTGSVRHIDLFYHKMSVSSLACRHERTAVEQKLAHVLCCFILYVQKPSKSTRNAMNLKWQAKQ